MKIIKELFMLAAFVLLGYVVYKGYQAWLVTNKKVGDAADAAKKLAQAPGNAAKTIADDAAAAWNALLGFFDLGTPAAPAPLGQYSQDLLDSAPVNPFDANLPAGWSTGVGIPAWNSGLTDTGTVGGSYYDQLLAGASN